MKDSDGKNYDMVSASSDLPKRLYDADLLAEIDTTKLTNYNDLWDQFKTPDYITFDSKLYGVNFAWGPTLILSNPDEVTTAPTSWNALFDEQHKGKISTWNYPLQIAQYALLLDPVPDDVYVLSDDQLAQIKDMLVKQRPLIRKYWDSGLELQQLFLNKEVVIADGWTWITYQLKAQGGKVAETVPAEGVTGWSDSWVISKAAKNYDLALKWADWMIGPGGPGWSDRGDGLLDHEQEGGRHLAAGRPGAAPAHGRRGPSTPRSRCGSSSTTTTSGCRSGTRPHKAEATC